MGMLGKLLGAVIDTAMVPVAVAADVVTLGGVLTDKDKPYTATQIEGAYNKATGAAKDAADGDLL